MRVAAFRKVGHDRLARLKVSPNMAAVGDAESSKSITTRSARVWLGSDGIVHVQPHARRKQTLDDARENVAAVAEACGSRPRPLLIHFQNAAPQTPECREHYTSDAATKGICSLAIVVNSMLGRIIGNLMMGMQSTAIPTRLFDNEAEAQAWSEKHRALAGATVEHTLDGV
jgi:hypothetical protein